MPALRHLALFLLAPLLVAQDSLAVLEGSVVDANQRTITNAKVTVVNLATAYTQSQHTTDRGEFRFAALPVGKYEITIEAAGFGAWKRTGIELNVSQTARAEAHLEVAVVQESVTVAAIAPRVDSSTNTLGTVVTTREILELPLNGRNFTQLGLLQAGVAPLTQGLVTAGGSLRAGHSYSVNGQRPESNNYLLDGAKNTNRMDAGFALRVPVDAISEFRILTHTAPAEYGGTSGSTTSVVTKSGSNGFHGSAYEFLRNEVFDARNFFSAEV